MIKLTPSKSLTAKLVLEILMSFILTLCFAYLFAYYILYPYVKSHQENLSTTFINFMVIINFVLSIIFFILCFSLMSNRHLRYIKYMAKGIKHIASHNLGGTLEVRGKDEISQLCMNINLMSKELKEKFDHERELERAKAELITNVSHDLRTPLTAIIGYLDILKNEKYTDKEVEKEYLSSTYNLSIKLKKLIDELFEYTKLSSNDIELELIETDLGPILVQILGEYTPALESTGLKVVTHIPDIELPIKIDVDKIVRVFDNILSNAEKYSLKPSDIIVAAGIARDAIVVSISNKGEHLEKEKLNKMFEKFYRVDLSRSSSIEGSGLGLAIAKKIIELHDGKIWAECEEDIITITISLPVA